MTCLRDAENECPSISLYNVGLCAPSSELLRACRQVYTDSRGIFIKEQRDFWSKTTFTIQLVTRPQSLRLETCLDELHDEQVDSIARVTLNIERPGGILSE
jgi:hypothetical protein